MKLILDSGIVIEKQEPYKGHYSVKLSFPPLKKNELVITEKELREIVYIMSR